jgi:hypothetical protein
MTVYPTHMTNEAASQWMQKPAIALRTVITATHRASFKVLDPG